MQVIPASSGYCLGSANWVISSDHEKIVYLSGSSTLTTHPRPMDHNALKNADVFIMTDLTQTPISNPDSMLGVLCVVVGKLSNLLKNKINHVNIIYFIFRIDFERWRKCFDTMLPYRSCL